MGGITAIGRRLTALSSLPAHHRELVDPEEPQGRFAPAGQLSERLLGACPRPNGATSRLDRRVLDTPC